METFNIRNSDIDSRKNDIIQTVHDRILQPLLIQEKITFSELRRKLDNIDGTFSNVRKKFSGRVRDNGEDAFIHQIEVVELLLQYSENPTFEKVLILLEHDTIEDTDISVSGMRENHNDNNLVFCVALMTKESFTKYINNPEDKIILEQIRKSGILNIKGNLSDCFHNKLIENNINQEEQDNYILYTELGNTYKTIRNKDYFENLKTYPDILEYAIRININDGFQLNLEQIENNIMNALECKLIDRLHGIITLGNCNLDKIKRKIEETEVFFKNIASQYFPELWKIIEIELEKIKIIMIHRERDEITGKVNKTLSKPSQIDLELF